MAARSGVAAGCPVARTAWLKWLKALTTFEVGRCAWRSSAVVVLLRYVYFAVSLDPVSEDVSAALRVRSVCPMCHQWQDFASRAIHQHLQIPSSVEIVSSGMIIPPGSARLNRGPCTFRAPPASLPGVHYGCGDAWRRAASSDLSNRA